MRNLLTCSALFFAACLDPRDVPIDRHTPAEVDEIANAFARRSDGEVVAAGEAPFADDGIPRRWARIEPSEGGRGRGGYLVEGNAGELWMLTFEVDGRTLVWEPSKDGERVIEHAQGHVHGGETVEIGIRDGVPVVLAYEYADGGDVERRRFSFDGACERPCPRLADFETPDARFEVIGPGKVAADFLGGRR